MCITSSVGVANVRHGFSIPPYGKDGGSTRMSYTPHTYGPHSSSAFCSMCSVSENSEAAESTSSFSDQTCERGPTCRDSNLPAAMAMR